jgi:hypothetical protein
VSVIAILWPLAVGIWLGFLLLLAGAALFVAIFVAVVIVARPVCAAIGIRRALQQRRAEARRQAADSAYSRTRSE